MDQNEVPDLRRFLHDWSEDLNLLRQNWLLNENRFVTFTKERGIPTSGAITGNPGELFKQGWLTDDGVEDGSPLFHPFRLYPFHKVLEVCALRMAPVAPLQRDSVLRIAETLLSRLPSSEEIQRVAWRWNNVADLAILLEPIYWPQIIGRLTIGLGTTEGHEALLAQYRKKALQLVKDLNADFWRKEHESLRRDAGWIDENSELYLLLRVATWDRRKELKGRVSGALWIRQIAEVIRRGMEEAHSEQWPEEDQAFGTWLPGGREREFGSTRPLDDAFQSKAYLAYNFGLRTGSSVRWYVEGETEYYAIAEIIPDPSAFGIEIANLRGVIARDKDNIALKLGDWLKEDRALRRFSMISFDLDLGTNAKIIRRLVKRGNIVGIVTAHAPDFEFSNFTLHELVEIAAELDEAHNFPGDDLRNADWTGIQGAAQFEKRYREISARGSSSLKGERWGRALAKYASKMPRREDTGEERPFVADVRAALHAWNSNYDDHRKRFEFDPVTFKLIKRPASS